MQGNSTPDKYCDKNIFKQIFIDHWDEFKQSHPRYGDEYYDEVIYKMLGCGDADKMGYVQYRCMHCGDIRRIAFTCKSSFCLSCAKVYTETWADYIGRRMLPGVTYRHIVFTTPEFLRIWFYRDPARMLPKLIQTGNACLLDVMKSGARVPLDIGTIVVLQTAGRPGQYNPHLHILLTEGGITPANTWKKISYIPFDLIHRKWQYHLLSMMREQAYDPQMLKDIDTAWKKYPKGFVAYVDKAEVPPGGEGLAKYLAKYVVSPPISVKRIEHYDGENVSYWYRDHKTQQVEHLTLPVLKFIGRMVQHILPKGFQRIRYYGLHANVRYKKMRETVQQIVPNKQPQSKDGYRVLPRKSFEQLFLESFGQNPLTCKQCGKNMELELIWHPKYGTLKKYELFGPKQESRGPPLQRAQSMVQIPLPLM